MTEKPCYASAPSSSLWVIGLLLALVFLMQAGRATRARRV